MLTNPLKALVVSRRFQPGEGPSRGLLRDCTTGCGTDGSFYSTNSYSKAPSRTSYPYHYFHLPNTIGRLMYVQTIDMETWERLKRSK